MPKTEFLSLRQIYLEKIVIKDSIPPDDNYKIRCPKLGHQIHFSYCRSENFGLPCFRILDCWFEHFQVEQYLRDELEPEEMEGLLDRPVKTKAQSLVEIIAQAKKQVN